MTNGANPNYSFEDYTDNWSNWSNQFPSIPAGVTGDVGFAVVNPDGTFDPSYPISPGQNSPAQPGVRGLAIGGWTNSQPGNGLYQVLTQELVGGNLTSAQQNLIHTILTQAQANGYTNIVFDYENYEEPPPDPAIYTKFLEELGTTLHENGMTLEVAMSPSSQNQKYYNFSELASSNAIDSFQVMCYDYAMGMTPPFSVLPNASIEQTQSYLEQMIQTYPNCESKIKIGVGFYGVSYNVKAGMTQAQIEEALTSGRLNGSYTNPDSPQISDDQILKQIGSWDQPNAGWMRVDDGANPPNYYYYNSSTGQLISSFPPESINDFAQMVKTNFPSVAGFFAWDADDDRSGTMMQTLMNAFLSPSPPEVESCVEEIQNWLNGLKTQGVSSDWIDQVEKILSPPPSSIEDLENELNSLINEKTPDGQDVYMASNLLSAAFSSSPTTDPTTESFNVFNLFNSLFTENPNLLSLHLQIPAPTFADIAYAKTMAWDPTSEGGMDLKKLLLGQFAKNGSGWTQSQITGWAYQLQPSQFPNLSPLDSNGFTAITTAWL